MANLARASKPIQKLLKVYSIKLLFGVIVFSLVISGSVAGPRVVNIPKCASFCTESSKYHYEPQSTYIYDYSTDVSTYVVHGSSGESRVHLSSKVEITPITQCDFELKLTNVQLQESELHNSEVRTKIAGAESLVLELEQRPIQFVYKNGKIENICSDENDSVWNLNVKRGILSMLQNSMDKGQQIGKIIQEVDVNGRCPTAYSIHHPEVQGVNHTILKVKDLKGCNHRHSHISGIQSIPYISNSPVQSIPLFSGSQECTQVVKDDRIVYVDCNEEHVFQPFDYVSSGAKTKVVQRLNLVAQQPAAISSGDSSHGKIRKTDLLFETESSHSKILHGEIENILKHMESLEEKNVAKIRPNAPEYFMELIDELRSINLPALKSLHVRASAIGKLFLLDALPFVGTSSSLAFMQDLLLEDELSIEQRDAWLISLTFIKAPSIDMIQVLEPLLNESPTSQALYGISSMLNSYCREHEDCTSEPTIVKTLRILYSMLGNCQLPNATVNSKEFLQTLYALKAIGNAGRLISLANEHSSAHFVAKCFEQKSNPIEIRLAAIDSFRRMPCGSYNYHSMVKHLKNTEENTEVRIQAYLSLMRCPNDELIETIKDVFYSDPVNQVVSFMWTHLTNFQETSSPDKQAIRELLSNEILKHKLSSDARKFSRNYEGTKFWEKYNVGAGFDANLIFSPDSFIPRSAMINLTSHLFGESINLLEFGFRVHSIEQLLEPIFGPAGYFPDQSVNQALHSMRARRDVANNQVDRLGDVYNQAAVEMSEPGGSFYTRIFGNEITSKSFRIAHKERSVPTVIDENGKNWLDLTYWLDNLSKGKNLEYTKSNVLMDVSYTVPTSAGLPLTLHIQSATTVGLNAHGRVNLENFWDSKKLEINGKLRPSAAIQVVGRMSISLGGQNSQLQSGLRVENTLHSSTSIEGKVMMKHGQLVHASLGLPEDKQEIFSANSQLYIVRTSGEKVAENGLTNIPKIESKMCTPKMLETILGLKWCGEISVPESFLSSIFESPSSASVYIHKTDTFTNYEFDYKWDQRPDRTDVEIIFNTPGSKINRRLAANYKHDDVGILQFGIDTPSKSLSIDGQYNENSPKIQFSVILHKERILFLNAELKRQDSHMEPTLILLYHENPIIEIAGTAMNLIRTLRSEGKANFDLNIKHGTASPVNINGQLTRHGDKYDIRTGISSHLITGNIKSQIILNENLLQSKVDVQYALQESDMKSYNINGTIAKSRKGFLTKYHTVYNFSSIESPENNLDFSWDLQSGSSYCENNVKVVLGKEVWTGKTLYSNQVSRTLKDLRFELMLDAPKREVNYNFLASHQETDNGFTSNCVVKFNSQNEFKAHVEYLLANTRLYKRNLVASASWNEWLDYLLKASIDENKQGEFDGEITINSTHQKEEMKVTLGYKNRSSNTRVDHSLEFRNRGFNTWPISGTFALVASEKLSLISGQLDIEGSEDYSGKWSVSLNYHAPKKHTRKIEGKLTLKETKYSGVLNSRRNKNGDRILVADFQLDQRVFMEAQISGAWPAPITTFVSIFPDKNKSPDKKIYWQSTIDSKSVNVRVDYFGNLAEFAGNYDKGKGQLETQWLGNKHLLLSFDISKFSFREAIFIINVESPVQNFGIAIQHSMSRTHLSTQLSGNVDEQKSAVSINGVLYNPESQLSIIVDIAQLKKLQTQLRFLKNHHELVVDMNGQYGEDSSNFRLEHSRTHKGLNCKLEFDGCSFIPKTSIVFSHQMSPGQFTEFDLTWVSPDGRPKTVNLRLEGEVKPWNYNLLITSPWTPLDKLEIELLTELEAKFSVGLLIAGSHSMLPLAIKLSSDGDLAQSENEVNITWKENGQPHSIRALASTKMENWKNANMKSSLEVFGHKYRLDLSSAKEKHVHKLEMNLSYDDQLAKVGFSWQCEKRGNLVKVSAWAEHPHQPRTTVEYHHLNDDNYFTLAGHVTQGDKTLGQIITEFHSTGLEHWEVTAKLNSVLNLIPTISFTSQHSIEDLNEIRHTTEFLLTENNVKLWGGIEDTKILLEFNLKNGRDLSGSVKVNEKEVKLVGILENEFEEEHHHQKIDLEISSKLFDSIHTSAEYKFEYDTVSVGFSASRNATKFIGFQFGGKHDESKKLVTGFMNVLCPFEHQLEGMAKIDLKNNLLEIDLREVKRQALELALSGQMISTNGHLKIDFNSKLSYLPNNMNANVNYTVEPGKFILEGTYLNNSIPTSINTVCVWRKNLKKLQVILNKSDKMDVNIELIDSQRLSYYMAFDEDQLFNFEGNYKKEQSEGFGMGKHMLDWKFKRNNGIFYNVSTSAGLDANHVLLNVQSPFEGFTNWTFDAQMTRQGLTKTLSLFLNNQTDDAGKYVAKIVSGDGLKAFSLSTPVQGLSNVDAKLQYDLRKIYEAEFEGIWDTNKISCDFKISKSEAEFSLQTPYEALEHISATTQWNLVSPIKTVEVFVQWNQETHQVSGEWEVEFSHGHANILVNTPAVGNYKFGMNYNLMENVEAQATLEIGDVKYELKGKLTLGENEIKLEVQTPFKEFEDIKLLLEYSKSIDGAYSTRFEWNINGKSTSVSVDLNLEPGQFELTLKTPIKNWTQLRGTLMYKLEKGTKRMEIHLEKEQITYFELKGELGTSGELKTWNKSAKASLSLNLQTALVHGLENVYLQTEYKRTKLNLQTISISAFQNGVEIVQGKMNFQVSKPNQQISIVLNGELEASLFGIQLSSLNGTFTSDSQKNEKSLQVTVRQNTTDKDYNIKASYQWTQTQFRLELQTPLKPLMNLHIDSHYENDGRIGGVFEMNKKKIELNGQLLWNGLRNSMLTCEIKTPFTNFKTIHAQINSKIYSHDLLVDYIFQNDNVRYMGKIDGSFDSSSGQLKIQLNSPIYSLEQVLTALYYNSSGLYMRVERNTKEEVVGLISLVDSKLELKLKCKVVNYPIDAQAVLDFGNEHIKLNLNVNALNSHLLLQTIVNGISFGDLTLNSSIAHLDNVKLNWDLQGGLTGGEAKFGWSFFPFGTKSIRTVWKNEDFKGVSLEGWLSSPKEFEHEKGFSMQYIWSAPDHYGNGKFGGTFTYVLDTKEEQVTISTAMKRSEKTNTMEFTLQTPFELLNQLTLSARFISTPEVVLDLSATHNQLQVFTANIVTFISPMTSKLKFSLNAPMVSEAFHLNVGYDLTTIEKSLDISFSQNKYQLNVKAQAIVPNNPDEIELRITVDSNVPSVTVSASGSLRASYKIQADETRQLVLSINSDQTGLWKVTGALRPIPSNFNIKFKIDSPVPNSITSLQSEFTWVGSLLNNIDADLSLQLGSLPPIKATLRHNPSLIRATFKSGFPSFEDLALDGTIESGQKDALNHKFHLGLRSGLETFGFEGDIQIPVDGHFAKGSVKVSSSWQAISSASLDVNIATNGTLLISGMWGARNINIRGSLLKNDALLAWKSVTSDISLSINAEEIFNLQSKHFFNANEQSVNLTMGDSYNLKTYFRTTPQFNTFSSTLQWSTSQVVHFEAEVGSGRFNASIQTPWTSDIHTHGEYIVSPEEYSAKATCIIDGQQSTIETIVLSSPNAFNSRVYVDVPMLRQKLEANMKILRPDEHYTEGSFDLKMKDRRIAINGSLVSNRHKHADNIEMDEQLLKLSISLPTRKYSEMNGEFSMKKSVKNLNRLQIDSTVTVGLQTAKGSFHYQLPLDGTKVLAIGFMADAPLLSAEKFEGLLDVSHVSPLHFNGELQYKSNHVSVSWDVHEDFRAKIFVDIPSLIHEPILMEAKGLFKAPKEIHFRTTLTCQAQLFTMQASLLNDTNKLSGRIYVHAPSIFVKASEIALKLHKTGSFGYVLDITATHEKDSFSSSTELIYEPNLASISFKVSGFCGAHFLQINATQNDGNYQVDMNAESMTLFKGKKMSAVGKFGFTENGFEGIMECRTRQATHSISTIFNLNSEQGKFSLKLESPYVKPINLATEYSIKKDAAMAVKLSANLLSKNHAVKFGYDLKSLEAFFNIVSPMLSSQIFNIHLKSIVKENHVDILGDFNVFGKQWKLETIAIYANNHHLEAKVEIRTPYESLHRITIATALTATNIHLELYTPMEELPNFILSISNVPFFDQINFTDFTPTVLVGLPWVTYSASALIQLPRKTRPGELGFMIGKGTSQSDLEKFKFNIQISPFEQLNLQMDEPVHITIKAFTPFANFKSFECGLGGRVNLKNWSEINLNGELNGKEIGFTSEVQREETNKKLVMQLKTPFENFERTTLSIRLENYEEIGTGRNIQLDFERSTWEEPIHTEIDYHYRVNEYPSSLDGELTLHLPIAQLPPIFLRFKSRFLDSVYNGVLEGHWAQWQPSVKLEAGFGHERVFGAVEAKLEDTEYQALARFDFRQQINEISLVGEVQLSNQQIVLASIGLLHKLDVVKCNILFKTPIEHLNSISGELRISPLSRTDSVTLEKLLHALDISLGVTFNDVKLFKFELVSKNNQRSLEIHNPIQPISFVISYQILPNKKLQVTSTFCWDLNNPYDSTVGVTLNYAKHLYGNDILLKVQGGETGTFEIETSSLWSYTKLEQNLKLNWISPKLEQNTSFGYYILFTDEIVAPSNHNVNNIIIRLDFPWRSVQTEYQHTRSSGTKMSSTTNMEFKWDVARDSSKRMGFMSTYDKTTARRLTTYRNSLTLVHSGLAHDMTFELEKVYKNEKVWETEFIFKPNSFPQDQLTVRLSHENIKDNGIQLMVTHPSTNIDINSILSLSETLFLFHLAYLDVRGEMHVVHMEAARTDLGRHYELSTGSDVHTMVPMIKLDITKKGDFEEAVSLKTPSMLLDSHIRTDLPYLDTRIRFGTGEELTLSIGLPHKRKMVLQILRNEFGQNIQDLFLVAKFNSSETFSTGIFWRPEALHELKDFVTTRLPAAVSESVDRVFPGAVWRINEEVEERLKVIDPGLDRVFIRCKRYASTEFALISSELQQLTKDLQTLHIENRFYTQDLLSFVRQMTEAFYEASSNVAKFFEEASLKLADTISKTYTKIRELSKHYAGSFERTVMNSWKSSENMIANIWNHYTTKFNKLIEQGRAMYKTFIAAVEGNMEVLEEKIYGLGFIRKLICLYEDYNSWLEELPIQGYLHQLKELFRQKVLTPLETYYNPYFDILYQVIEDGNLYSLLEVPPVPYARFILSNIVTCSARLWRFVEAEQRVRDLAIELLSRLHNIIQRHLPLSKLTLELWKGHVEYHQPLTFVDWEDFTHLPKWKVPKSDADDVSHINELLYAILDTMRIVQPFKDLEFRRILPPFGSNAIMAGDHHYLTFDKKYYRFAGDCSYVLIADLGNQNFTLTVNYEANGGNSRKKSYSLISANNVVEIDTRTFKVTLDGKKVDLPLEVGPTFIRRQASGLEIFDKRGFQMQCSLTTNVCSVSVSGWHFGKLGGLLGTYDNEPNNDLKTPDGQIVTDVANFAHSWRVGGNSGQCRMRNFAREFPHYQDVDGICAEHLIGINSPFRPCFNEVPTGPFIEMCKYDTTRNLNSAFRREAACSAISAYVTECQKNGVDLWMTPTCVTCKLEDGSSLPSGENATLAENSFLTPPSSSDIVIIVEETTLLQGFNLNNAISKLEFALKAQGLVGNRYAVVGFGGHGPYKTPHIRTSSGQVWTTSTLIKIPDTFPMNGNKNGDLYEAIEFGAGIGFRAGVSKTVVAFIADDDSSAGKNTEYSDTLTLLIENDIKLHIMSPKDILLKGNKRDDGNKIFGFDLDGVFTLWQSKRGSIESDKALKRYVSLPKDLYTPLAVETSGTRFNMNHMKSSISKTFLDVWARLVAKSSQPSKCQFCECVPDKFGGAVNFCQQCISPTFKQFLDAWDEIKFEEDVVAADNSEDSLD